MDRLSLQRQGFVLARAAVPEGLLRRLTGDVNRALGQGRPGDRRGLRFESVRALLAAAAFRALVVTAMGEGAWAVKATLFDKTRAANWLVAWHQDVTVAVRERRDVPAFGPWSRKQEVWHARAPAPVLERMLAVRVHLDEAAADRGALRVLPGSHARGRLEPREIAALAGAIEPVVCPAGPGDALLMRPLLVHASSRSAAGGHRRVVHLEFASAELPHGLEWNERVALGRGGSRGT